MRSSLFSLLIFFSAISLFAQDNFYCEGSEPFCTGTNYEFPAGTGGSAQSGPYYGCLYTQPNPAWYHMRIGVAGSITISMHSEPSKDIDFICWGPFDDAYAPCTAMLTESKVVDCSYSPNSYESCTVPNGVVGEYYILLITNYSNQACNIIFSQSGGDGETDCSILPPDASSNSPVCMGDTLKLYAADVTGATYYWNGPGGFTSSLQNPDIPDASQAHSGNYSCMITVGVQSNSTTIFAEVKNRPTAAISGDADICPGEQTYLTFNMTGAAPWGIEYTDGFNTYTENSFVTPAHVEVAPTTTKTYSLLSIADAVCSSEEVTGSATVFVNPEIELSNVQTECNLANSHYTVSFEIAGGDPSSYTVDPPTGTITSGSPYIFTSDPIAESTPYEFSVSDGFDCEPKTLSGTQSCQCPAVATISGNANLCQGESAEILIELDGTGPWMVTLTENGSNPQDISIDESPYTIDVSPSMTTVYALSHMEDQYCTGTTAGVAEVSVFPQPEADFNAPDVCSGFPTQFTDLSQNNGAEIVSWLWDFDDAGNTSVLQNPDYTFSSPGDYNVTLTIESSNGCESYTQKTISVHPNPVSDAGPDQTINYGTSTSLSGSATGGSGDYSYHWEPVNLVTDPASAQTQTVNLDYAVDYYLEVTDNTTSCSHIDDVFVDITGAPLSVYVSANPSLICYGSQVELSANAQGGNESYSYSWHSDPQGFNFDIPNPVVSPEQTTTFYVDVNDGYNTVEGSVTVEVVPNPIVNAGPDQEIPHGAYTQLDATINSGSSPFSFSWQPDSLLDNHLIEDPLTHNLTAPVQFNLSVIDRYGCSGDDNMLVDIIGGPLAASVFVEPSETICYGESVTLRVVPSGGTGNYDISWTNEGGLVLSTDTLLQLTPEQESVFTVSIDDGYNTTELQKTIYVNPLPVIDLIPEGVVPIGVDTICVCVYDTLVLDAGNPGLKYVWSNGSSEQSVQASTTGIGFDMQSFEVVVTDPATTCFDSASLTVIFSYAECTGIDSYGDKYSVQIIPNPNDGDFVLDISSVPGRIAVDVLNTDGKLMYAKSYEMSSAEIHIPFKLPDLNKGVYLLRITNNRFTSIEKMIVR